MPLSEFIDITQPSFWLTVGSVAFNPTFWNIAARSEYHNKTITRLFNGNSRNGCYALAVTIFSLGIIRDYIYHAALSHQPTHPLLLSPVAKLASLALLAAGNTLVLTSMYALGVTGTYLGDYFGILMDHRVTSFPFSVTDAPMYVGSTLSFLGTALWYGKPAGVALTAFVWLAYSVALRYEDPFTAGIYERREVSRQQAAGKGESESGKKEL
ncbi:phospholipid methyltransferase-domain-containing protein [Phyllosticta citribraziliensis]|uniref:Phosphatidyl-N-methylethanolamine N-methyltransferase n=1 Tax=Phyllosticta citribraziliensis TaxID=989973 RepID=A0ABR1LQ06_9PEZI